MSPTKSRRYLYPRAEEGKGEGGGKKKGRNLIQGDVKKIGAETASRC